MNGNGNGLGGKLQRVKEILLGLDGFVLAFSGGVDSTLLAKIARDTIPAGRWIAMTAESPLRPEAERRAAARTAAEIGMPLLFVSTGELNLPEVAANSKDRCYHCKKTLFRLLAAKGAGYGFGGILDGSNGDDRAVYRPGHKAAVELDVISPLAEAGLCKEEIRSLSRSLGLSNWDGPAQSCLATRFPYGTRLSLEELKRVEDAESFLHGLGLVQLRVRVHGRLARLEVNGNELVRAWDQHREIAAGLREKGYDYITLDLDGFRSGSFDGGLPSSPPA